MTERRLRQVVGVEGGVEDHAQGGGHQAHGAGPVAADGVGPAVDGEPFEQAERAPVVDALQDAEQAAHVDQRRVDHDHARPQAHVGGAVLLVVLGPDQHLQERLVGERHPLGRPGGAAREHLDRHCGRPLDRRRPHRRALDVDPTEAGAREPERGGAARTEGGQVVGLAGQRVEVEGGEVGPHPVVAAPGVDDHHAGAGAEQAEQQPQRAGAVPHQQTDPGAGADVSRHCIGRRRQLAPGVPAALELERRRGRVEGEDLADPPAQLGAFGVDHRSRGSGRSGPVSAISAWPIGLPRRV